MARLARLSEPGDSVNAVYALPWRRGLGIPAESTPPTPHVLSDGR